MAAAALGEQLYGLGAASSRDYLLPLSSASASAAPWCMTARCMRGAWGNAGEIGHIPVVPDGEPCPCGNRGCLERYLSLEAYQPPRDSAKPTGSREVAPIFRNAIAHHREPVRSRDRRPRRPRAGRPARTAGRARQRACPTRSPRGATARAARHGGAAAASIRCCAARPRSPSPACCRRASARCSPPSASADLLDGKGVAA